MRRCTATSDDARFAPRRCCPSSESSTRSASVTSTFDNPAGVTRTRSPESRTDTLPSGPAISPRSYKRLHTRTISRRTGNDPCTTLSRCLMDDSAADNGTHHKTGERSAPIRAVPPLGREPGRVHGPLASRVENRDVRDRATPERAAREAERSGRRDGHPVNERGHIYDSRLHEPCVHHGQCCFQANDPIWRVGELALLFVIVMRRVVGRDQVDRAITNRLADRLHVLFGTQRWVHLRVRIVPFDRILGERQVMRTRFRSNADPALLTPPDELHRAL